MHKSAIQHFINFQKTYLKFFKKEKLTIYEIGSKSLNSEIKNLIGQKHSYKGIDIEPGKNVDIVLDDPYKFPIKDNEADVVISISNFEHIDFFWLTYLEILRILKPEGIFYLCTPSNSNFHRHPNDNWRFYPDSAIALSKWAKKNGYLNSIVLEHFTHLEKARDVWNDYVSITLKDSKYCNNYKDRIIDTYKEYQNARVNNSDSLLNYSEITQDQNNWGWKIYFKLRKFLNKINL